MELLLYLKQNNWRFAGFILYYTVVIIAYSFCGIEYYLRYSKNSPITSRSDKESNFDSTVRGTSTKKLKHMAYAMVFMTTCLFVRYVDSGRDSISYWKCFLNPFIFELFFSVLSTVRLNCLMAGVDVLSVLNFISVRDFFSLSCLVSDLVCVLSRCFRWCNGCFGGLYYEPCAPREIVGCIVRG